MPNVPSSISGSMGEQAPVLPQLHWGASHHIEWKHGEYPPHQAVLTPMLGNASAQRHFPKSPKAIGT